MIDLVFATHNKNKIAEIQLLVPSNINIISLADIGCHTPIPETADTLEGNAQIKADFVTNTYQLPCFSDDTGLLVASLNNEPGVYSARYAGADNNAQKNMDKLLGNLKNIEDRTAQFKTVIALNMHGEQHFFKGRVEGAITEAPTGTSGFGYDPIFMPHGYTKTFGELSPQIKSSISHRGIAFSKLVAFLGSL